MGPLFEHGSARAAQRELKPLRSRALLAGLLTLLSATAALADPAPFDLAGPNLLVKVTHAGKTLPISAVPNLSAGDKLWIRAALPENAV